jgi:hypothetical protein
MYRENILTVHNSEIKQKFAVQKQSHRTQAEDKYNVNCGTK